ncbi:ISLre2 family transposase [Aerococcaceae bacterium NML191292]|nr:ISLre2 family transposase [Aerococcaceae bacterium NML191292]
MMFDEFTLEAECQSDSLLRFLNKLKSIEHQAKSSLESRGWKYVKTAERTVVFTIGEVRFSRRCYKKGNQYRYPLDEALKLEKYTRYSQGFLMQLADLATRMPYRKVVETMSLLKGIMITKDTVLKAVKLAGQLYEAKQDCERLKLEEASEKRTVNHLYIEGDGILVKTPYAETAHTELAHFVIHEGCGPEYGSRQKLIEKYEILSANNRDAREQVLDYVFKRYNINHNTLVVTNSDLGKGYSANIFKELVAAFKCKHIHYWDKYHLYQRIRDIYRNLNPVLSQQLFESLKQHDKQRTKTILQQTLAALEDEKKIEEFEQFSRTLLNYYQYTKERPIELRRGVGIIESQQCKIASRMKHRGMYWSKAGAEAMGKLIIDIAQQGIRELFLGEWRQLYHQLRTFGAGAHYLRTQDGKRDYTKRASFPNPYHKYTGKVK